MYLFFLSLPFNNTPKVNHLTCTLGKYPSQVIGSPLFYQILQAFLHKLALNLCSTTGKIWTQEWALHTEAVFYCSFLQHCTQLVSFAYESTIKNVLPHQLHLELTSSTNYTNPFYFN